jgi:hypothetical protein
MYKIIFSIILIFFISGCKVFEIRFNKEINESNVVKLKVPIRQERTSWFHEDEDLSYICEPKQMVFIKFSANQPSEVWCEK